MFRRGDFVAFVGYLGAGKTMTAFLIAEQYHSLGWPIVANVDSTHFVDRYTRARSLGDVFLRPRNSIVIFDEAGIGADARSFGSEANKSLTKLLYLMRKRGNILFYTVQALPFVDNRFRELTKYVFFCEQVGNGTSIARFCVYDGLESAYQRGQLQVRHSRHWHLYNSFDDDVVLVDDISSKSKRSDASVSSTAGREAIVRETVPIVPNGRVSR